MEASKTIRVVIADDHAILRQGLCSLLEEVADIEVVGEASDGQEALKKAAELKPDVIILDVSMPGTSGLQAARKFRTALPETAVIMLTVHEVEEYVYEALRAGVKGYVLKDAAPDELVDAVRMANEGKIYLSEPISRLVVDTGERSNDIQVVSQSLTKREREVCRMLAMGHTVPEIAKIIGISRKTVDVHKTRLMKKLDIHNRAGLVRYAVQNRLVEV